MGLRRSEEGIGPLQRCMRATMMMMNFAAQPHVPESHLLCIYEGWGAIMFTDVQSGFSVCFWLVLEVSGVWALLHRARQHVTALRRSPPHV